METELKPKPRSWRTLLRIPQERWVLISRWFGKNPTPVRQTSFLTRRLVRYSYRTAFQDFLAKKPRLEQVHEMSTFEKAVFRNTMNPYLTVSPPAQMFPISKNTMAALTHTVVSPVRKNKIVGLIPDEVTELTETQKQALAFEKEVQAFKRLKQQSARLHVYSPFTVKPQLHPWGLHLAIGAAVCFGVYYFHFAFIIPVAIKAGDYWPKNYYELRQLERDYDAWATFYIQKRLRKEERRERMQKFWHWIWYSGDPVVAEVKKTDDGPGYKNRWGL